MLRGTAVRHVTAVSVAAVLAGVAGFGVVGRQAVRADTVTVGNDPQRTGWYPNAPQLSPGQVSDPQGGFRQLWRSAELDGQVYAQPLVVGTTLIAATESNSLYGIATVAGSGHNPGDVLWRLPYGSPFQAGRDLGCNDLVPNVGITSTPVVDPARGARGTVYFVTKSYLSATTGPALQQLHALDLASLTENAGFPVTIAGTSVNGGVAFNSTHALQRPGLLLLNGSVYMGFGGHCDDIGSTPTFRGWVVGVNQSTAAEVLFTTDQVHSGAGVWQSGGGLATDGTSIYFDTGNYNDFGAPANAPKSSWTNTPVPGTAPPIELPSAIVRLDPGGGSLRASDFFAPANAPSLDANDTDPGSGSVTVLPDTVFGAGATHPRLAVTAGKSGDIFVLDRDSLGGYRQGASAGNAVEAHIGPFGPGGVFGSPALWPGDGRFVYYDITGYSSTGQGGVNAFAYSVTGGSPQLSQAGTSGASGRATDVGGFDFASGSPVVSSTGTQSGTAVVWVVQRTPASGGSGTVDSLVGLDAIPSPPPGGGAAVLSKLAQIPIDCTAADSCVSGTPHYNKFARPAIDGNRVYVGTRNNDIRAYGLADTTVSGNPLTFDPTPSGQTETRPETITTASTTPVTLSSITSSDRHFTVVSPTSGTVSASAPLTVQMTFTPGASGRFLGSLRLVHGGATSVVGLSGLEQDVSPHLAVAPAAVAFGTVADTASPPVQLGVSVTNDGGAPFTLTQASLSPGGPASPFTLTAPAPSQVVQPAQSITFQVTFDPGRVNHADGTYTDALSITTDVAGQRLIPITGALAQPAHVVVSPLALDFGTVSVGQSATRTFTLTNTGGVAATVQTSKPPALGVGFTAGSSLPEQTVVAPGQTLTETVRFGPGAPGAVTDRWAVDAADGQGLRVVTLTGAGAPAAQGGYWLVGADGGIFPFGPSAAGFGSTGGIRLNQPIVGITSTSDGAGYWLVASDGGIFPFGDAPGYGSTGSIRLNRPVVDMAAVPSGGGYWLVAADGGIFPFGPAAAGYGSTGAIRLNQPIVGIAATPDGLGYYLVAADGGIFPFGPSARGYGSTGNLHLNQPIVGMAVTRSGSGYWLVAADGGIFPFGDAVGYGSTGNLRLNRPIVAMARTPDGGGYWLVAADGGIFPFGDAAGYGSTGGERLNRPIVSLAAPA